MPDAIKITIHTKDNLLITSSLTINDGNVFSDFGIEPFFPAIEQQTHPEHAIDITDPSNEKFVKLDETISTMLKNDFKTIKKELGKMGIELAESKDLK
jgi:hypothetical protein